MAIKIKAQSAPYISDFDVNKVNELNFFDLSGSKAGTKGTSNKMYHAELHYSKDKKKAQILTTFGPTGRAQRTDYRYFCVGGDEGKGIGDISVVDKEYEKLLKSKRKKGYKDIDVAQRSLGSDEAKQITKAVKLNNTTSIKKSAKSKLNEGQKKIVSIFLGAQDEFVSQTLKCPLGQLTNKQIDDGRACLDEAKKIVNSAKTLTKKKKDNLLELTNDFYGLIPHNLGSGARGQMSHLLLDEITKIMGKEDDLDTLLDAKQMNAVAKPGSSIDDKYKSLNCEFEIIDSSSELFQFLATYYEQSKVDMHRKGAIKVKNIWKMHRLDAKEQSFITTAKKIAGECGKNIFAKETSSKVRGSAKWSTLKRPDLTKDEKDYLNKANNWLCWHGTRSANLAGITRRGLLVRPSGAVHTGSMYGDGKYFAWQSSKSLNYCDGGYWTGGGSNKKYMFLLDVAMGNMLKAGSSHFYRPKDVLGAGYHSVYAKGGNRSYGGVMNDEMITYDFKDNQNQSAIKYVFELQ